MKGMNRELEKANETNRPPSDETMRTAVELVAEMAQIGLGEDEWKLFTSDLLLIDDSVKQLSDVGSDVENPMVFVVDATNVMREDEVRPSLPKKLALANAPKVEDDCFWVPRILDV